MTEEQCLYEFQETFKTCHHADQLKEVMEYIKDQLEFAYKYREQELSICLEKCPFCGEDATIEKDMSGMGGTYVSYFIQCKKCGASTGKVLDYAPTDGKEKAIELWNKRTTKETNTENVGLIDAIKKIQKGGEVTTIKYYIDAVLKELGDEESTIELRNVGFETIIQALNIWRDML